MHEIYKVSKDVTGFLRLSTIDSALKAGSEIYLNEEQIQQPDIQSAISSGYINKIGTGKKKDDTFQKLSNNGVEVISCKNKMKTFISVSALELDIRGDSSFTVTSEQFLHPQFQELLKMDVIEVINKGDVKKVRKKKVTKTVSKPAEKKVVDKPADKKKVTKTASNKKTTSNKKTNAKKREYTKKDSDGKKEVEISVHETVGEANSIIVNPNKEPIRTTSSDDVHMVDKKLYSNDEADFDNNIEVE